MKGKLSLRLRKGQPGVSLSPALSYRSENKDHLQPSAGLNNLGNTCYCNAILQALRYCPGVCLALKSLENTCDKTMIQVLKKLMQELDKNVSAVTPLMFLQLLRDNGKFTEGVQHDAQELLNHILTDGLIPKQVKKGSPPLEDLPVAVSKEPHKMCGECHTGCLSALFEGKLVFQTRCFDCDHHTGRTEPFLHVTVPVTSQELPGFPPAPPQHTCSSSAATVSLSWCLSRFMRQEHLTGDNKFWCENCRHLVEAERSILFSDLPTILTLHLNRFSVQKWGTVSKVANSVAVPLSLCFRPWSTQDCPTRHSVYRLHAVVLHSGSSCHSGHYTTLVQTGEGWLHCDDETVTVISDTAVQELMSPIPVSASPYILFYSVS